MRVNYDYFNYVVTNGLNMSSRPAQTNPYALPWRTSAYGAPKSSSPNNQTNLAKTQYEAGLAVEAYRQSPS